MVLPSVVEVHHLTSQFVRGPGIVSFENRHIWSRRRPQGSAIGAAQARQPAVLASNDLDPRVPVAAHDLECPVRGAVVNDDQFPCSKALGQDTLDRIADERSMVVRLT
jgi:hypothetical protein